MLVRLIERFSIALIHDVRHLNARTLNDGMIAWSHGLLGGKHFQSGVRIYDTLTSEMSIELFSKWNVDQLKGFLKRGGFILSGRKAELAEKAYCAWKLKLEVAKTTQDQENDISTQSLTAQRCLKFLLISQY